MQTIFMDLLDHDTEEIKIKDFVDHMLLLCDEPRKSLLGIMTALDADNSGTISLDEFLDFFGMVKNEEDEEAKAQMEQMLNDELWPKWLIKEAKLGVVQNLFYNMFNELETLHGISAESAFGIYDMRNEDLISDNGFDKVIRIFFDEIVDEGDIVLLKRLTDGIKVSDGRINYRKFCKFMDKKLVRTFKNVSIKKKG
jgi:Ca2+-binding EF-hand superfamily protein